jgi:hypothetical protein
MAGYLIVAPFPQSIYEKLSPVFKTALRYNAFTMGVALILETILKVALDITWRYVRLDTEGIQPLSRWIPRRIAKTTIILPSLTKLTGFGFQMGRLGTWPDLPSFLRLSRARRDTTDEESTILLS